MSITKDVHTEHCCLEHGCKYNKDDTCTVVTGEAPQSFPCESCEYREEDHKNNSFTQKVIKKAKVNAIALKGGVSAAPKANNLLGVTG